MALRRSYRYLLLLIVVTGATLLAYLRAFGESFWIDEVISVEIAARGHRSLLELVAYVSGADVHPPGYYLLLSAWGALFGFSEVATRLLSALLFAGCLWTLGRLTSRWSPSGVLAVLPFALLPIAQHYAVEVRAPALVLLFVVLTARALMDSIAQPDGAGTAPRRAGVRLAVWLALGLWADYLFAIAAAALVTGTLLFSNAGAQARRRVVFASVVATALFAPFLPGLLYQLFDLPRGFTAHLAEGPGLLGVLADSGPLADVSGLPGAGAGVLWGGVILFAAALAILRRPLGEGDSAQPSWRASCEDLFHPRTWSRAAVLVVLAAPAAALFGAAVFALTLPLPEALVDLWLARLPYVAGLPAVVGLAGVGLATAGHRLRRGAAWPQGILAGGALLFLLMLGALSLARPMLLARTALPALPLGVASLVAFLGRRGGVPALRRRAALTAFVALMAVVSAVAGERAFSRPDLRSVAARVRTTAGTPVAVLPRWEVPGVAYYGAAEHLFGVDTIADAAPVLPRSGWLVLGRAAHRAHLAAPDVTYRAIRAALPHARITKEVQLRGFTLLFLTP